MFKRFNSEGQSVNLLSSNRCNVSEFDRCLLCCFFFFNFIIIIYYRVVFYSEEEEEEEEAKGEKKTHMKTTTSIRLIKLQSPTVSCSEPFH